MSKYLPLLAAKPKNSDLVDNWAMLSLMLPNQNYDRSLAIDLEDANVENAKRLNDYHIFHGQLMYTASNRKLDGGRTN